MSDDPKKYPVSRRTFLGLLGGGLAALLGGSRVFKAGKVVEQAAAPVIQQVPGMPNWFPALVTKIKTQGTKTRTPDYADFTSGGDTEAVYVLKDKSLPEGQITLYENEATGAISINGRGDELQQVQLSYTPGENVVRTDALGQRGIVTQKPSFEADEFYKGTEGWGDIENFGGIDDLKGGLNTWEEIAKKGTKAEEAEKAVEEFIRKQTDPNIVDDFAEGGRVGFLHGGIVSKRRDSFYNGMGSLFKERI